MIRNKKISVTYILCLIITVTSALTFKPIRRYYQTSYGYPEDYNHNTNYHYNGYEGYSRYYGHSPYYNSQQRSLASNDKFDYGSVDASQETLSQIYKMGETSGRELTVPEEWNDLNWVVLIGRKPTKKKYSQLRKKKNMLQIKPTYKQKRVVNNPFLPLHKYYNQKENEKPLEPVEPLTALHKVAGPPYNDEVPLNISFTHNNAEDVTHMASASSTEAKKEVFIPSERFIPSPSKSDPNSMVPVERRPSWRDHVPSPSAVNLVSSRVSEGRSFSSQESIKLQKFIEKPTYTFEVQDARINSRTPRTERMDTAQFSRRSSEGISDGSFRLFATVGYPNAHFRSLAI
ncbi:UNVERIFIED_CONTAM: hypothetical protein RMT77_008012 [Armadillidium vulgare]